MESGWVTVLEEKLVLLGGDVLTADIPADFDQHLDAGQDAAYAALLNEVKNAESQDN
jgi:hypothetical protein